MALVAEQWILGFATLVYGAIVATGAWLFVDSRSALKHWRTPVWSFAGALGVPYLFLLLWWLPEIQVWTLPKTACDKPGELINQYRATLAQILGGAGLLAGAAFAWLQFRAGRQKDIGERYNKAAELLGSRTQSGDSNLEARVAAILALQRIYEESAEHRWNVLRLLCSYVRMNSQGQQPCGAEVHPREDIATALDAICFRSRAREEGDEQRLDLTKCQMEGAYFAQVWSTGENGAQLAKAYLWDVNLRNADLRYVDFRGANLYGADLSGATVRGAQFEGAVLTSCKLNGVDLSEALGLDASALEDADGDEATRLPTGIARPTHWPAERIEEPQND